MGAKKKSIETFCYKIRKLFQEGGLGCGEVNKYSKKNDISIFHMDEYFGKQKFQSIVS